MDFLLFLNGLLVGIGGSFAAALFLTSRRLNAKTELLNTQLTETLNAVVESHNTLNKSMAAIDKRATETSLRVDQLMANKPRAVAKFPSIT